MGKLSGKWMGIGIAVLVVGGLAMYASGSSPSTAPATGAFPSATAAAEEPRSVPAVPGMSSGELAGIAVKLGIVGALLGGSLWLLRRYAGPGTRQNGRTGLINIADTVVLAQGRALYVVDVGDRALVVGATPQQLSLLAELTDTTALEKLRLHPERPPAPWTDLSQRINAAVQGFQVKGSANKAQWPAEATPPSPSLATTPAGAGTAAPPATTAAGEPATEDVNLRLRELAARIREARRVA
jgi:flagellar biogenesis protein FliO